MTRSIAALTIILVLCAQAAFCRIGKKVELSNQYRHETTDNHDSDNNESSQGTYTQEEDHANGYGADGHKEEEEKEDKGTSYNPKSGKSGYSTLAIHGDEEDDHEYSTDSKNKYGDNVPVCGICKFDCDGADALDNLECCGHIFHKTCLQDYVYPTDMKKVRLNKKLKQPPHCPECKKTLTDKDLKSVDLSVCKTIQNWFRVNHPDKRTAVKTIIRQIACGLSAVAIDYGFAQAENEELDKNDLLYKLGCFYGAELASWLAKTGLKKGLTLCGLEDLAHDQDLQLMMRVLSSATMLAVEDSKGYALVYGAADNHLPYEGLNKESDEDKDSGDEEHLI